MIKIKRFFTILWRSIVDFSYYQDIYQASFSFSLKYLFVLFFLLQFVIAIIFGINMVKIIPQLPSFVEKIKTNARDFFPQDLSITLNNGNIRTNVDEPYFIELPKILKTDENKNMHLITIDTKASAEDIKKLNTIVLVTKNALVFPDNKGYKIQFLNDIKGYYTFNKYTYEQILQKIFPYLNYLPHLIYGLIIFGLFFLPWFTASIFVLTKMFYLFIFSLIFLLIVKLLRKNLGYKKIFQLAIHASTLPILIAYVAGFINFTIPPFTLSLVLLLFMIVVINKNTFPLTPNS